MGIGPADVWIPQGVRHSLVTAGVVLAAPMSMAAASIEGSPLRDAVRAPFEGLGLVSPEEQGDEPAVQRAPQLSGDRATETDGRVSGDLPETGVADAVRIEATGDDNVAPATPAPGDAASSPVASGPAAAPVTPAVDVEPQPAEEPAGESEPPPDESEPTFVDPLELVPDAVELLP